MVKIKLKPWLISPTAVLWKTENVEAMGHIKDKVLTNIEAYRFKTDEHGRFVRDRDLTPIELRVFRQTHDLVVE